MRMLSAPPMMRRTAGDIRQLLDGALAELAPGPRLSRAHVSVSAAAEVPAITLMRPLVAFAIEACISTVLTLAGDAAEPALAVSIGPDAQDSGAVSIGIRLEAGWLPAETARRLTDMEWAGHPGGTTTAMIAAAAETIATLHDGSVDVTTDYEGFGITLTLRGRL